MHAFSKEKQEQLTPDQALDILKEGNKRFVEGKHGDINLHEQMKETAGGQYPFAVILSCIDSRTSVELIFDQGIGDVFSARVAGNIVNEDLLGSMEFACKVAGSKLILVLGHTACGAVKGACDDVKMGNLSTLLSKIRPSVEAETSVSENRSSANGEFVEKVSKINVLRSVDLIKEKSEVLREMADNGEIKIVGATHDISNGIVNFY